MRAAQDSLLATANLLEAQAMTLRALAAGLPTEAADEVLCLRELASRYGLGRGAVLAAVDRRELVAVRGARGKILVARLEVERWLRSRPVACRPERPAANDLDAWSAGADAELARLAAGARR